MTMFFVIEWSPRPSVLRTEEFQFQTQAVASIVGFLIHHLSLRTLRIGSDGRSSTSRLLQRPVLRLAESFHQKQVNGLVDFPCIGQI